MGSQLQDANIEIESLQKQKAAAIEEEDYDLAAGIKKRLLELAKRSKELESAIAEAAVKVEADLLAARCELEEVIAKKLIAVENEDFLCAKTLKQEQDEIETRIAR